MIHVAPCSCELHQALREALERNRRDVIRIRELEADYRHENEGRRAIEALYTEQKARAEKAEARVAELEKQLWLFEKPAPAREPYTSGFPKRNETEGEK